ncbi:MFS transporter [Actinacidiphila alni]|uniref:MFS transporter n=1 Tax=Actinacidiphila alni TaxID=380248 RepID=UPI0034572199
MFSTGESKGTRSGTRLGTRAHSRLGPGFQRVWVSVTVSSLGDGMRFVALPLLAARLTDDPRQIAAVSLAEQVPWVLLGLVSGALADRVDRRRVLWMVDAVRAAVVGVLALAVAAHAVSVPLLAVAGFLLGCGQTLYNGAWAGMVPALVEPAALTRANARIQAGSLISDTLIGTPLGAVLFGVAAALPFGVDAVSFAVAAALALALRGDFRPRAAGDATLGTLRHDTAEGVRWLWRHRLLRRLCVVAGTGNLVAGGLIAILVLYARHTLGLGDLGFALLVAAFAVGGIAGAAATPRLSARFGEPRLLRATTLGSALAAVGAAAAPGGPAAGAAIAVYGATSIAWNITAVSQRQSLVPNELLGRVTTAYQMVIGAASALGALAAGLVAHHYGLRSPFFAGAALLLASALVSTRPSPAARPGAVPQEPTPAAAPPAAGTGSPFGGGAGPEAGHEGVSVPGPPGSRPRAGG